jgi:hypothetical protein
MTVSKENAWGLFLFRRLGLVDRVLEGVEAAGFKCAIYDKELVYVYTQYTREVAGVG